MKITEIRALWSEMKFRVFFTNILWWKILNKIKFVEIFQNRIYFVKKSKKKKINETIRIKFHYLIAHKLPLFNSKLYYLMLISRNRFANTYKDSISFPDNRMKVERFFLTDVSSVGILLRTFHFLSLMLTWNQSHLQKIVRK